MLNNTEQKDSLLPPPEIISRYKELGVGEDIIKLVKKEQEHRHVLQNKYQNNYRMGQFFGFLLCVLVIINIFYLIKIGFTIEAYSMLACFSILTIAICFITRTKSCTRRKISTNSRRSTNNNNTRRRSFNKR